MLRLMPTPPDQVPRATTPQRAPEAARPRCMPYPLAEEYLAMGTVFGTAISTGPNGFEALADWLEVRP